MLLLHNLHKIFIEITRLLLNAYTDYFFLKPLGKKRYILCPRLRFAHVEFFPADITDVLDNTHVSDDRRRRLLVGAVVAQARIRIWIGLYLNITFENIFLYKKVRTANYL